MSVVLEGRPKPSPAIVMKLGALNRVLRWSG